MNQGNPSGELLIERKGMAVIVTLNRPKALNALSIGMIRGLLAGLDEWEMDENIAAVMIRGAGGKAFCAGGDVKEFHRAGREEPKAAVEYFAHEYSLNKRLFNYMKPVVSFMNGITMGGGYGVAGNSSLRFITDNTVFAMPETKIGFFPDVGSVYHLVRSPDHTGWYLALTGNSIGLVDILRSRLAEIYIPLDQEEKLISTLADGGNVMDMHQRPPGEPAVTAQNKFIESVFCAESVPEILKTLEKDGSDFAQETLRAIRSRSPISVMVTAEHLRRAKDADFNTVIETDFTLVQNVLKGRDMFEGIRAVILDKDNKPQWNPAKIEDISDNDVKEYFTPQEYNLNDIHISTV